MENRTQGSGKKDTFISYLNDDDKILSAYVEIIEIGNFVTFRTNQNVIRIPSHRVLKIKEKLE